MNHDEYSLVREVEQEEIENKPTNFGTLTMRGRKGGEKERDVKMENLKKKLRTDDESKFLIFWKIRSIEKYNSYGKAFKCCRYSLFND